MSTSKQQTATGDIMARSEYLEQFARKIGFYAFNRWAKNQGLAMETTLRVIRAVY